MPAQGIAEHDPAAPTLRLLADTVHVKGNFTTLTSRPVEVTNPVSLSSSSMPIMVRMYCLA